MSTVQSNPTPVITWVADKPSSSGKTVRVLLMHDSFEDGVTHYAYIPTEMAPVKWDAVEATTVKLGPVEVEYEDRTTGEVKRLQNPQRQVSFFGDIALCDGPEVAPTTWVDKRAPKAPPAEPEAF